MALFLTVQVNYYVAPSIRSVRFAPDDKAVAIGDGNGDITLWSVPNGQLRHRLSGQRKSVVALAFTPDGTKLASGSNDDMFMTRKQNSVKIWDVRQGVLLHSINEGTGATSVVFSPDGKLLASGDNWGNAALWSVASGAPQRRFNGHNRPIRGLGFSPDGKTLATGSEDRKVKLWALG